MFIDPFQEKIWKDKYQYDGETFEEFCDRIASTIFPGDKTNRDELLAKLKNFEVLFGGRVNSNIGIPEKGLTLFNCFIEAIVKEPDSLEGIMDMITKYTLTLKTEGGVGFCADFFRPAKTIIRKIGVTSPGAIKFLEIFDKASEVITSGGVSKSDSFQGLPTKGSIRKGATMVTMSISHPDIEEFITAKAVPNRLTKMNMSVLVTDEFIDAVKNNRDWDLWFPDINCRQYDPEWDGNLKRWREKNYPIVVYKTIPAVGLWDLIMRNSYTRNEPGVLFIDNARHMNNLHYLNGEMVSCNPCAEVMGHTGIEIYRNEELLLGDVCCLGSLNITKFYDPAENKFCLDEFRNAVSIMVESLDRVIDVSNYPLAMYEHAAKLKRKIGVGITGIGSLMMMMNMRYGSEECVDILESILSEYANQAYKASALLAKKKGPFPLWNFKAMGGGYIRDSGVLRPEVMELIRQYGLRNSALMAIAPNGTLSILAGNVSGGLEPVFAREFTRWNRVEGVPVDFEYPNVHKGEWFETDYFKKQQVADEVVLMGKDGEYRVDKNNGLCKKITIKDYGYKVASEMGHTEVATATELSIDEHLNVLRVFSKYVDQSSSKTINLVNGITFEEFKELYSKIHEYGIKGCTTYREGTSVAVLEAVKKEQNKSIKRQQKEFLAAFKNQEVDDIIFENVELPEEYPAKGYILTAEGNRKWYLHCAFKDKNCTKPFAVFVNTNAREDNVLTFNALEKLEEIALHKGLKEEFIEDTKRKYAYQKNPVKICRTLGLLLRHNVSVFTIVQGLRELEATVGTFVFHIIKFLGRFIEEHEVGGMVCPECGEKSIVFSEGCFMCSQCQHSRCG